MPDALTRPASREAGADPGDRPVRTPPTDALFWIAKLATTIFGEAFSDYVFFNDYLGRHLAIALGLGLLVVTLAVQFAQRRYRPVPYWATVTAVSIFGTMSADYLDQDLGMPLWASTSMLLALQAAVFGVWALTQRTLDVHRVDRPVREALYWASVVVTFSLGTAAGDVVATTLGWGSLAAGALFAGLIVLVPVGLRVARRRTTGATSAAIGVAAFWVAYTLTRPLGASLSDWLGVPAPYGDGLQLGTGPVSLASGVVLLAVLAALVRRARPDARPDARPETGAAR